MAPEPSEPSTVLRIPPPASDFRRTAAPRGVAEEYAGGAVAPVNHAGHGFGSNKQNVVEVTADDHAVRQCES